MKTQKYEHDCVSVCVEVCVSVCVRMHVQIQRLENMLCRQIFASS